MWHFDKCILGRALYAASCIKLITPNAVQSVAQQSENIQTTNNGSDQAAHMRRLVLAFAGLIYHIVGNLVSRFNYSKMKI